MEDSIRTSYGTFLKRLQDSTVAAIEHRLASESSYQARAQDGPEVQKTAAVRAAGAAAAFLDVAWHVGCRSGRALVTPCFPRTVLLLMPAAPAAPTCRSLDQAQCVTSGGHADSAVGGCPPGSRKLLCAGQLQRRPRTLCWAHELVAPGQQSAAMLPSLLESQLPSSMGCALPKHAIATSVA